MKKNMQQVRKRLAEYAYNYAQKQHQMMNIFRSQYEIQKEREIYLQRHPKMQAKIKQNFDNQNMLQKQQKSSGIKRTDSFNNLTKKEHPASQKQDPKFDQRNLKKIEQKKAEIFNSYPKQFIPAEQPTMTDNFMLNNNSHQKISYENETFSDFVERNLQGDRRRQQNNIENKNTTSSKFGNSIFGNNHGASLLNNGNQNSNTEYKKQETQPPQKPQVSKQPEKKEPEKKQAEKKEPEKKEPEKKQAEKKQAEKQKKVIKITSSEAYLNGILKYCERMKVKTEISTKIGNLNGSKSDPREFWQFTSSYIKTINPARSQEVETFTFLVWQAIIHKFIKNANSRQGFERIFPKLKSQQVQKNSINTYILYINTFRAMGFQAVWLGVFGKTLEFLDFLIRRKDPITKWRKLQLISNQYVQFCENISARYQSKLDSLTYFLLGLTTFDPIEVFTQISEKTKETYPFIDELRKYKYKWSYRQFWCLVDVIKNNKLEAYFKIPFWNNVLSVIYPQLLAHLKNQEQMKEFAVLSKWIFKEVKTLTNKISNSVEGEALNEQFQQSKEKGAYEFDGEDFIGKIKTLGRIIGTREKEMAIQSWEQFRDNCSVFYYFWRQY